MFTYTLLGEVSKQTILVHTLPSNVYYNSNKNINYETLKYTFTKKLSMIKNNKKIGTISTIFLSAIIMGIVFTPIPIAMAGNGTTLFVDEDGMADAGSCDNATGAFSTIQSAIDDADPGDTIVVCPHDTEYAEAVEVNVASITVEGIEKPKVDGTGLGPAFNITEDGVVLSGFEAISDDNACIRVEADNTKIVGNIASGCGGDGIDILGNDSLINANTVNDTGNDGIDANGNGNLINANTANGNEDNGIEVDGNNNLIKGNTADNNDNDGINVFGDDNNISGNSATGNNDGMLVKGDNNIIKGNTVNDNDDDGIICIECNFAVIQGNTANGNPDEGLDLVVVNDSTIQGNTANGNGEGIDLSPDSTDNVIKGNTANDNDFVGFEISGGFNIISNNNANNNGLEGIELEASSEENDVTHNVTNDNGTFGITDTGMDNTFDKNRCRNNVSGGSDPSGLCAPQA